MYKKCQIDSQHFTLSSISVLISLTLKMKNMFISFRYIFVSNIFEIYIQIKAFVEWSTNFKMGKFDEDTDVNS